MTVQPNGTDAKDIALYFLKETGVERATPAIIGKTIKQAKHLLSQGYEKEEILSVIDHIVAKGVHMYSIGYVSHAINEVLKEIEGARIKEEAKSVTKQLEEQQLKARNEVKSDGNSAERNRNKARGFGIQSRFGEKFNFDLFEE